MKDCQNCIAERKCNVVALRKPEGLYLVAYGTHFGPATEPLCAYGDFDGVCFEGGLLPYPKTEKEIENYFACGSQGSLFKYAKENQISVYAADCSLTPPSLLEELEPMLELALGAAIFRRFREKAKAAKFGRTLWNLAGIGAMAYLSLPFIANLARSISASTGLAEKASVNFAKMVSKIHPEYKLLLLALRNAVLAQKMEFIFHKKLAACLLAALGANHVGIEDMILSPASERLEFLSKFSPILPKIVIPETFYQIIRYQTGPKCTGLKSVEKLVEPNLREILGK